MGSEIRILIYYFNTISNSGIASFALMQSLSEDI